MLFRSNLYRILSANDLDTSAGHMPRISWLFSSTYGGSLNGDTRSSTDTFSETFVFTAVSVMLMRMLLPLRAAKYNGGQTHRTLLLRLGCCLSVRIMVTGRP